MFNQNYNFNLPVGYRKIAFPIDATLKGYIDMEQHNEIALTEKGMEIARRIYDRHKALTAFLIKIGVDEETAREDACKIEHDLSDESYAAICSQIR